jgi:flagellar FliL protein
MADEDKTVVEAKGSEAQAASGKKSPVIKYGIYAGMLFLIVIAAYALTLFVVKPMFSSDAGKDATVQEGTTDGHADAAEKDTHGGDEGDGASDGQAGDIYMIDNIIVNPAGTGGTRFLSAAVGIEVESEEATDLLSAKDAVIRDALIMILSSQTIPELTDYKNRERIRRSIKARVEKLLSTKDISAVYFTEFVLQ